MLTQQRREHNHFIFTSECLFHTEDGVTTFFIADIEYVGDSWTPCQVAEGPVIVRDSEVRHRHTFQFRVWNFFSLIRGLFFLHWFTPHTQKNKCWDKTYNQTKWKREQIKLCGWGLRPSLIWGNFNCFTLLFFLQKLINKKNCFSTAKETKFARFSQSVFCGSFNELNKTSLSPSSARPIPQRGFSTSERRDCRTRSRSVARPNERGLV